ncbi:hypothetical protein JTE90_009258 [Oedothorax gibbosus]|uniref:Uncharacterized protein n=1 Tax=Oedothorax gibbosus TaxID=931172 RepID=A0AAV6V3G4_9ARAC|nr:hypothetical protein JTE90_009258 [Oedothorax gibbosus]
MIISNQQYYPLQLYISKSSACPIPLITRVLNNKVKEAVEPPKMWMRSNNPGTPVINEVPHLLEEIACPSCGVSKRAEDSSGRSVLWYIF